ncbi:MAG: hypothetical protein LYZ69_07270 [Nitrososphaerales archaeon]|nr:hypothetical protein [Nitrososphaerales archaeon]
MPSEGTRPPVHSPEFKPYFEGVIKSSKGLLEAVERMGYGGPSSVRYHMKKLGIEDPDHWYVRPPAWSHKFASYFEDIVKTSKNAREAANRLGYAAPCMIYHHVKRLGIETPEGWLLKPGVRRQRQGMVPEVIMHDAIDRAWSGGLVQGESGIVAHYSKRTDVTSLELRTGMTEEAPIFKLCDCFGVARPQKPRPRHGKLKPIWECVAGGLRAYRVLQELLPFLLGGKLKEAERALEFFAPDGYHKGHFGGYDVWPRDQFPSRSKGRPALTREQPRLQEAKRNEG